MVLGSQTCRGVNSLSLELPRFGHRRRSRMEEWGREQGYQTNPRLRCDDWRHCTGNGLNRLASTPYCFILRYRVL